MFYINTIVSSFKTYVYENHKNYIITFCLFMYIQPMGQLNKDWLQNLITEN